MSDVGIIPNMNKCTQVLYNDLIYCDLSIFSPENNGSWQKPDELPWGPNTGGDIDIRTYELCMPTMANHGDITTRVY